MDDSCSMMKCDQVAGKTEFCVTSLAPECSEMAQTQIHVKLAF